MEFRDNQAVYLQIVDVICERILQKKWKVGEKLVSIRELAMELQVTPNTVQRSYDYLQELGVIAPQRGIGLFVEPDAVRKIFESKKEAFTDQELPLFFKTMDILGITLAELATYYKAYQRNAGKKMTQ